MSTILTPANPVELRPVGVVRTVSWLAVLGLLGIIVAEITFSTRQESQTFDEAAHLYSGYEYWMHGDYGRNPEHPPLVKLLAGAALLPLHPAEPVTQPGMPFKREEFVNATKFLYASDPDGLLARGRAPLLLFTLGLAVAIFSATREMFGTKAGLLAIALFAFEPMVLAHGALITTDMALSCTLFCSVCAFYRYRSRPSPGRLAVCSLAIGLTLVAKHSGVFVFPILGLVGLADILLSMRRGGDQSARRASGLGAVRSLVLVLAVSALVGCAMLWACYGFHYSARPAGLAMDPTLDVYTAAMPNSMERAGVGFCARHHLLPESYLYGWADILQIPGQRVTFLLGTLYRGPRWFLYPVLILIKTSLPLLLLCALVPFAGLWRRTREFLFLVIPAAIFLLLAMVSGMNGEARYVLPMYPFCIVLAGAAAWETARRSRAWAVAIAAVLGLGVASSLHAYPYYLAYANEAFGGPGNSYRIVTDSNGDWSHGLKFAKRYLDDNRITDCWIDYIDPYIDPRVYGIPCRRLPSGWTRLGLAPAPGVPPTISGTVLVSATELGGRQWGPDVLNPYQQFRTLRPDATPGDVMVAFHGTFEVPLLSAYSHLAAADLLLKQMKTAEALAEAREAVVLAPNSAYIQAGLGRMLMAAGQTVEAEQTNQIALGIARNVHPEFQGMLIRQLEHKAATVTP